MFLTISHCLCAEIGATAKAPAMKTMKGGIIMGYCTIVSAYLCVSITGEHPVPHQSVVSSFRSSQLPVSLDESRNNSFGMLHAISLYTSVLSSWIEATGTVCIMLHAADL
jgi:hypothetical protein